MNLKDILGVLGAVAPTIASAIGGPLAGTAVGALKTALGLGGDATDQDVAQVVAKATPEQLLALKQSDQQFALDIKKLDIDLTKTYVADTSDARRTFGGQKSIFWLGIAILLTFAAVMAGVLYGCYALISGAMTVKDAGLLATSTGLIGTITGYVAGNAQQVVGYFFGSSQGSADKTEAMAQAVTNFSKK